MLDRGLGSWKGELEVTSRNLVASNGAPKDYDAIVEVEVDRSTRRLGIEYERCAKATFRYTAICAALDKEHATDAVLNLTPNDDILCLLAMELRSTRK